MISDENGIIEISKEWLQCQIQKVIDTFPMDYFSRLSDCKPIIEVRIMDESGIKMLIRGMKLLQDAFQYSQSDIDNIGKSINYIYNEMMETIPVSNQEKIMKTIQLTRKEI